jgi:ferritin-like metal-binding protein YciE
MKTKKNARSSAKSKSTTSSSKRSTSNKGKKNIGRVSAKATSKQNIRIQDDGLNKLFFDELEDMYSAENQIVESLPNLIKRASSKDLKDGLKDHLKETKFQVKRIEKIFTLLGRKAKENPCEGMEGLLKEADEMVNDKKKSPVLDAAIISAAQKVEHYEMASYGALRSFAQHLNFDSQILDLIQDSLDEEGAADKKLTKIAEGGLFFGGINKEAARLSHKDEEEEEEEE